MTGALILSETPSGASPILQAATKEYVDDASSSSSAALSAHIADAVLHISSLQNTFLDNIESGCISNGTEAASLASDICALKDYASSSGTVWTDIDNRVLRAGDTMTGFLTLAADPLNALHAATRQYVLAEIDTAVRDADGQNVVRYFASSAGGQGQQDGDIHTSGTEVFIWANGAWRKVFPAVYT